MRDLRKELGMRAKQLRETAKKTQKDVATALNIYPSDLSTFENTGKKLGLDNVLRLFDVLGAELTPSEKKTSLICG